MNLFRICLVVVCTTFACTAAGAGDLSHLWSRSFGDSGIQTSWSLLVRA